MSGISKAINFNFGAEIEFMKLILSKLGQKGRDLDNLT